MRKKQQKIDRAALMAMAKKYNLPETQIVIDIVHGCVIVFDRSETRYAVIPPDLSLPKRRKSFDGKKHPTRIEVRPRHPAAVWTSNVHQAYRAARDTSVRANTVKPVLVIYEEGVDGKYVWKVGWAETVAGRLFVSSLNMRERKEAWNCSIHQWTSTVDRARVAVARMQEAQEQMEYAKKRLHHNKGKNLSDVTDFLGLTQLVDESVKLVPEKKAPRARKKKTVQERFKPSL